MSDWQQVGDLRPSPIRTQPTQPAMTQATLVTPSNYYDGLNSGIESDSDSDNVSFTSSAFLPDSWDGRQSTQDPTEPANESDASDTNSEYSYGSIDDYYDCNIVDYKQIRELMETKRPGSTTPTPEPTTIQLHHFKKTLVSALSKCPLNASNKGHTYIIETTAEHRARNRNTKASLPPVPTEPIPPSATADRAALAFYLSLIHI